MGGCSWGKFSEGQGGLEGSPPLRKRGGCASKVFRSFLTSPRESFNQRAELGAVGVAVKIETA